MLLGFRSCIWPITCFLVTSDFDKSKLARELLTFMSLLRLSSVNPLQLLKVLSHPMVFAWARAKAMGRLRAFRRTLGW